MKRKWCSYTNEESNNLLKTTHTFSSLGNLSLSPTSEEQHQFGEKNKQLMEHYWECYELEKEKKNYPKAIYFFAKALKKGFFKTAELYALKGNFPQEIED